MQQKKFSYSTEGIPLKLYNLWWKIQELLQVNGVNSKNIQKAQGKEHSRF